MILTRADSNTEGSVGSKEGIIGFFNFSFVVILAGVAISCSFCSSIFGLLFWKSFTATVRAGYPL